MPNGNEAFSRVVIDAQLTDQGWNTQDPNSVRYEYVLPDSSRADYVLYDRNGRSMAVIEAKRFSINPGEATDQAKNYARQLGVPNVFLALGQPASPPPLVKSLFAKDHDASPPDSAHPLAI